MFETAFKSFRLFLATNSFFGYFLKLPTLV